MKQLPMRQRSRDLSATLCDNCGNNSSASTSGSPRFKMSEDKTMCAACDISETDDIKLVPCDGCDLVRYCSDDCREDHKSDHEDDCNKRAAELRDELLFKQPESSHLGDCPICSLPLSLVLQKSMVNTCCSKVICM